MTANAAAPSRHHPQHRKDPRMRAVRDTWLIFRRSLILTIRQPTWIVIGIMYPVIYLVLFGPLLDGAIKQAGAGVSAYNWFVPGLLIQVALFGTAFGGFGLIAELRYGVVERMRVTPMSRSAMLLGRSLRDVVILLFQALIMIGLAIPFGLHIDLAGVAVTLALLALIGLVVAPLSYAAALILKSEDAFAPLVQSLVMPLLLLSGILLPMALAPDWLRFLSNLNPLTHATDAARALFNSDWGNPEIRIGVAITAAARRVRRLVRVADVQSRQRLTSFLPLPPHAGACGAASSCCGRARIDLARRTRILPTGHAARCRRRGPRQTGAADFGCSSEGLARLARPVVAERERRPRVVDRDEASATSGRRLARASQPWSRVRSVCRFEQPFG